MKSKTILLTGATGFVGSHLLEALIDEGYKTIILKRSFSDIWRIKHLLPKTTAYDINTTPLEQIFRTNKIDIIIHTATQYGKGDENIVEIVEANLVFPLKLLKLAKSYGTQIFINTDTFINRPVLSYKYLPAYTLSKRQFSEWLETYSDKIQIISMKLQHAYGPKDDNKKFVSWLIDELLNPKQKIKLTKGEQKRDFIFIRDIIKAYLTVLKNSHKLENHTELDIGSGEQISIKDFVLKTNEILMDLTGKNNTDFLDLGALQYREGELMEIDENIKPLLSLGWKSTVSVENGLSETIQWHIKNKKLNS